MWYKDIERKLIIEKLLPNMRDIKVFCVDGKAKLYEVSYIKGRIEYSIGTAGMPTLIKQVDSSPNNRQSYYDMNWEYIPDLIRVKYPAPLEQIDKKPLQLDLMKEYSEKLSRGFKFVRVDFIVSDEELYCEELTFAPGGGFSPFKSNGDELMYQIVFG
jgi:D-alanine-D-alanine ligase-like ATP-grasp enzyme